MPVLNIHGIASDVIAVVVALLASQQQQQKVTNKQSRKKEWSSFHLGLEESCGVVLVGRRNAAMAAQRAQNYLDIHKIGPLFEVSSILIKCNACV